MYTVHSAGLSSFQCKRLDHRTAAARVAQVDGIYPIGDGDVRGVAFPYIARIELDGCQCFAVHFVFTSMEP